MKIMMRKIRDARAEMWPSPSGGQPIGGRQLPAIIEFGHAIRFYWLLIVIGKMVGEC